jgi:hypothetical protein
VGASLHHVSQFVGQDLTPRRSVRPVVPVRVVQIVAVGEDPRLQLPGEVGCLGIGMHPYPGEVRPEPRPHLPSRDLGQGRSGTATPPEDILDRDRHRTAA